MHPLAVRSAVYTSGSSGEIKHRSRSIVHNRHSPISTGIGHRASLQRHHSSFQHVHMLAGLEPLTAHAHGVGLKSAVPFEKKKGGGGGYVRSHSCCRIHMLQNEFLHYRQPQPRRPNCNEGCNPRCRPARSRSRDDQPPAKQPPRSVFLFGPHSEHSSNAPRDGKIGRHLVDRC